MSKIQEKPQYEPPRIISLNQLTLGSGDCVPGSGDVFYCNKGSDGINISSCNGGGNPDF